MPKTYIEHNECHIKHAQTEVYGYYKKSIKHFGKDSVYDVPMGLVGKIQSEFNVAWMRELIIGKGLIFNLPCGLGRMFCRKYKPKLRLDKEGNVITRSLPVDWYTTKQKWAEKWPGLTPAELKLIPQKPIVYCLNEHSGGYRYEIYWDNYMLRLKNHQAYNFVANRTNHRYLAHVIKNPTGAVDYYDKKPRRFRRRNYNEAQALNTQ